MNLLLCGHGYLGQEIARVFRAASWDVSAVSRSGQDHRPLGCGAPPSSVTDASTGRLATLACEIGSAEAVEKLASRTPKPDFIIHCASSSRGGPDAYRNVFLDGCGNLHRQFDEVPLLFTSSTSVYAQTDGSWVDEDSPAQPDRKTGRILLETERSVLDHGGIVTRLAGIYGPGRSVILKKFLSGAAVIEEDGRRFLNQIHRDDAARAILHLATSSEAASASLYNLADSRPLSQLECYTELAKIFDRTLPRSGPRDPNRKRGWTHKRVSNARLIATGWTPAIPCFLDAAAEVARSLDHPET